MIATETLHASMQDKNRLQDYLLSKPNHYHVYTPLLLTLYI